MSNEYTSFTETEEKFVLEWMQKYCNGFRSARTKQGILPFVRMTDRKFRAIISKLKHDGHVAATCTRGYWFVPLVSKDVEEVNAALESVAEMKSRALDMLTGIEKQMQSLQNRKLALTQQVEMFV